MKLLDPVFGKCHPHFGERGVIVDVDDTERVMVKVRWEETTGWDWGWYPVEELDCPVRDIQEFIKELA